MKLSVIIPVYNEVRTIAHILAKVQATPHDKEILIIDDFSTDGTREFLQKNTDENVHVFYQKTNQGKGAALKLGFEKAQGDIIIIQDADLEYDPDDYKELISPIVKGLADVVYGSRFLGGRPQRSHFILNKLGNRFLTLLSNFMFNHTLSDMNTCYKAFQRELLPKLNLKCDGFAFDAEFTAKVCKLNLRIYEVPIVYHGRNVEEGKKLRLSHGFGHLWALIKYRFTN
ncbi:MAG: glycosyl transferase [Deltaproteobacteria bacterium RIFCSPHIGHO2_02_FULL_40_11]|nr:MAG: glycosyl transferase [Deltaproteobacteria bacterium RIFCSPHIGHO2_02_FULL_40_11]